GAGPQGRPNPCLRPNVAKAAGIEQEPQQPADLPVTRAALHVRSATNDDQVVARDDKGVLTADALGEKGALGQLDRRRKAAVERAGPPQVTVPGTELGARVGLRALLHPLGGGALAN